MMEEALLKLILMYTFLNIAFAIISLLMIVVIIIITYNKENHSLPVNRE